MDKYNLTSEEQEVLDLLQLRDSKTQRKLARESGIFSRKLKSILVSLRKKGLADTAHMGRNWVAL